MRHPARRAFLQPAAVSPALFHAGKRPKPTDIRVEDVELRYQTA